MQATRIPIACKNYWQLAALGEGMTECLGCNYIETALVVLEDGRTVCATCPLVELQREGESDESNEH